jgi:hypothetical protein
VIAGGGDPLPTSSAASLSHTDPVTDPETGDPPVIDESPPVDPMPPPRRRLRLLPALAIAAMLVAGGLLMAVGGMARIVEPAPPTPIPTVGASQAPSITPLPTKLPVTPTLGPSPSPFG